jgi:DNA repair exonuclease SbcCD ATPase subunit
MKSIRIDKVEIQAFKSFVEDTVSLPIGGFNFLGGRNELEPQLGANGAGKSSFWDAICWCFYGTDALGNRASDLVHRGAKRPIVKVGLVGDEGEETTIERHGNPNKLLMDGSPVEQAAVDFALGLNAQRFLQSVLFAQKGDQFYEMKAPERGLLMDSILDLGHWLELSEKASKQAAEYERELRAIELRYERAKGAIPPPEETNELIRQQKAWSDGAEAKLAELVEQVERIEKALPILQAKEDALRQKHTVIDAELTQALRDQDSLAENIQKIRGKLAHDQAAQRHIEQRLQFFEQTMVCPTCEQKIGAMHVVKVAKEVKAEEAALTERIAPLLEQQQDYDHEWQLLIERRKALQVRARSYDTDLSIAHSDSITCKRRLDDAVIAMQFALDALSDDPYARQIAGLQERERRALAECKACQDETIKQMAAFRHADYWKSGFKKVRLFLIKQALAFLELETSNAAQSLGLLGWKIEYVTEVETKSGSLKAGIAIRITDPSADGPCLLQSGGEEQRIRMAVTIGIASMIQRMAGVDYGIEIWDEPTAHLSAEGISDMLECLRNRASVTSKAVWIVDHQIQLHTGFDRSWLVRKTEQGSIIEKGN